MPLDLAAGHAWLERHRVFPASGVLVGYYWRGEQLPDAIYGRLSRLGLWPSAKTALADAARAVTEALAAGELED